MVADLSNLIVVLVGITLVENQDIAEGNGFKVAGIKKSHEARVTPAQAVPPVTGCNPTRSEQGPQAVSVIRLAMITGPISSEAPDYQIRQSNESRSRWSQEIQTIQKQQKTGTDKGTLITQLWPGQDAQAWT